MRTGTDVDIGDVVDAVRHDTEFVSDQVRGSGVGEQSAVGVVDVDDAEVCERR